MQRGSRKYYTEKEFEERATEIAAEKLGEILTRVEELTQGFILTIERNRELQEEAKRASENAERMAKAAIYYDETYNRLPAEMKETFNEIGKGVNKEYGLY